MRRLSIGLTSLAILAVGALLSGPPSILAAPLPNTDYAAPGAVDGKPVSGDFDGDGIADLAAPGDRSVTVLRGRGGGDFDPGVAVPVDASYLALQVGDLQADGFDDLVVAGQERETRASSLIVFNGSTRGLEPGITRDYPDGRGLVAVLDLDADPAAEISVVEPGGGQISVLEESSGSLMSGGSIPLGADEKVVGAGEFGPSIGAGFVLETTDEKLDSFIRVLSGDLDAGFSRSGELLFRQSFAEYERLLDLEIADLDADGSAEVIALTRYSSFGSASVSVYGGGATQPLAGDSFSYAVPSDSDRGGLAISDFNGDGSMDLVSFLPPYSDASRPTPVSTISVLTGAGDGTLGRPIEFEAPEDFGSPYASGGLGSPSRIASAVPDAVRVADLAPAFADTTAPETQIEEPVIDEAHRTVSIEASSDDPLARFECSFNGGEYQRCDGPRLSFDQLRSGGYSLRIRAFDQLRNTDKSPESAKFSVSWPAPDTEIGRIRIYGPPGRRRAETTLRSDDSLATFRCSIDGGKRRQCDPRRTVFGGLEPGRHVIVARARGRDYTTDRTPARRSFLVERPR